MLHPYLYLKTGVLKGYISRPKNDRRGLFFLPFLFRWLALRILRRRLRFGSLARSGFFRTCGLGLSFPLGRRFLAGLTDRRVIDRQGLGRRLLAMMRAEAPRLRPDIDDRDEMPPHVDQRHVVPPAVVLDHV